jgi:hypothetical protein
MADPLAYYGPEMLLFAEFERRFAVDGQLTAAPRARQNI